MPRGYESFAQECFEALSPRPELELTLFKGGGEEGPRTIRLANLHRGLAAARLLGGLVRRDGYFVEQLTFFASLVPHLHRSDPDVVLLSDQNLATMLSRWRALARRRYKIIYHNSGPHWPSVFHRWDFIQQVAPINLDLALEMGVPREKQALIPDGVHIPPELALPSPAEKESLRERLSLPRARPLLLSVGGIDAHHKRMDYVIAEAARLPEPRPYVLLLGMQDARSAVIVSLGNRLLGEEHFQVRTVPPAAVADYYRCADAFALASLGEGFGRVYAEALSHGLPCLAHDHGAARFVLGDAGYFGDFRAPGALAALIPMALAERGRERERHRSAYERLSWEKLAPRYVEMIRRVARPREQP